MNKTKSTCDHTWVKSGLWDGKTPEGQKTGGIVYQCTKCGKKAYNLKTVQEEGGTLDDSTDVFGRKAAK